MFSPPSHSLADHCCSVKIQKITVPPVVVMDYNLNLSENSKRPNFSTSAFLLDCEYDVGEDESGLVIKWFLNNNLVYQWIPPRAPAALSLFKNRIRKNYTVSEDPNQKYRSVSVLKPVMNFSGEYTCSVQTFQSSDRKSSHLQIIGERLAVVWGRVLILLILFSFLVHAVPESHFKLTYRTDYEDMVHIKCSAFNVYPEPKLSLKYVSCCAVCLHAAAEKKNGVQN
jgi:hypothetical protein